MERHANHATRLEDGTSGEMTDRELRAAQEAGAEALSHISNEEIDELLNEIDTVLEENANRFVRTFVQSNGQ